MQKEAKDYAIAIFVWVQALKTLFVCNMGNAYAFAHVCAVQKEGEE